MSGYAWGPARSSLTVCPAQQDTWPEVHLADHRPGLNIVFRPNYAHRAIGEVSQPLSCRYRAGRLSLLNMTPTWAFLTNHANILLVIAQDPDLRLRDIAERVGVTERTAQSIIGDLCDGGYLIRGKQGRRNSYQVQSQLPLRHRLCVGQPVADLLNALLWPKEAVPAAA